MKHKRELAKFLFDRVGVIPKEELNPNHVLEILVEWEEKNE